MSKRTRRSYSKEFKSNAVKMILEEVRKISEVARELQISDNMLHTWKQKYKHNEEEASQVMAIKVLKMSIYAS